MLRTHTCGEISKKDIDTTVTLSGWVQSRRDHGGVIFLDLRDQYGVTQVTVHPEDKDAFRVADGVRSEFVIQAEGVVQARPDDMVNTKLATGEIEVVAKQFRVINKAKTPPFEISEFTQKVGEDVRLQYRYLDLRQKKMHANIKLRHEIIKSIRDFMVDQGFYEIETPFLVKGTPEGAREYLVPSRLQPGNFYVLPQSPQQMKQLLMVGGFDRYFQIVRCFRDEDQRGDRQPEFTQLDVEMAFVDEQDVMDNTEQLLMKLAKEFLPDSKILATPFPVFSYDEAMNRYGTDRPDLRFEMELTELTEELKGTSLKVFQQIIEKGGVVKALRVPGGLSLTRKDIDEYTKFVQERGLGGLAYIQVDEKENRSPILKFLSEEEQKAILEKTGAAPGDIVFFAADTWETACEALGALRVEVASKLEMIPSDVLAFAWVNLFPMFAESDIEDSGLEATHNPFSAPVDEDVKLLGSEPMRARSKQYDIVLNGTEIGGGSVRNHDPKVQKQIFEILGLSPEQIQSRFGHMLKAYEYGAPIHGGIAWGLDRLVMIFAGEENIREVTAFPKNQTAQDLMLGAPSELPESRLKEAHIKLDIPKKKK